jgi:hypothetical protein
VDADLTARAVFIDIDVGMPRTVAVSRVNQ